MGIGFPTYHSPVISNLLRLRSFLAFLPTVNTPWLPPLPSSADHTHTMWMARRRNKNQSLPAWQPLGKLITLTIQNYSRGLGTNTKKVKYLGFQLTKDRLLTVRVNSMNEGLDGVPVGLRGDENFHSQGDV